MGKGMYDGMMNDDMEMMKKGIRVPQPRYTESLKPMKPMTYKEALAYSKKLAKEETGAVKGAGPSAVARNGIKGALKAVNSGSSGGMKGFFGGGRGAFRNAAIGGMGLVESAMLPLLVGSMGMSNASDYADMMGEKHDLEGQWKENETVGKPRLNVATAAGRADNLSVPPVTDMSARGGSYQPEDQINPEIMKQLMTMIVPQNKNLPGPLPTLSPASAEATPAPHASRYTLDHIKQIMDVLTNPKYKQSKENYDRQPIQNSIL